MLLDTVRQLHRNKPLAGRRIAVLATDGFEMVELVVPAAAMRLAGAMVDVISIHPGRIRGMNLHEPASTVGVDWTLDQADPAEYDGLLIPGGFVNPDLLRQSAGARAFVRSFGESGKPIASLCHGPWVLASAGSWGPASDVLARPSRRHGQRRRHLAQRAARPRRQSRDEPRPAGPKAVRRRDHAVVRRGRPRAGAGVPVVPRDAVLLPPDEPPRLVLDVMRWMPKPSVCTILGLAVAGVAVSLYLRSETTGQPDSPEGLEHSFAGLKARRTISSGKRTAGRLRLFAGR